MMPIGERSNLYPDIVYTPTKMSIEETKEQKKENPFNWSREFLISHHAKPVIVESSPEPKEKKTSMTSYWDVWKKDDNSNLEDMEIKVPTGKVYTSNDTFKNDLYNAYLKVLKEKHIDPNFAKYLVAQDALESGWGKSSLSAYNNFGGIKASKNGDYVVRKTKEWNKTTKSYDTIDAKFRAFRSLDDYCKYKIDLLGGSNYKTFTRSPEEFADSLTIHAKYKYATDPDYKNKINRMYKSVWG